ncbi:MotA/TolQ/ExbB proton channel family protein [Desulfurivibrio alkaliphilus]|uniref:MotA/TolQ/ExbB proton channel n=1 Tax=Desulfurivibrio alkaliphilus (strain DSM 19089 / UNIQEM U267 / AHT2) TaxID=589865 RepID=D6Z3X5_DESAT|nr:MotA/TolQ/ExbB proton channel family protein [Desulfurivibrio alkaliphilus]ADH86250.1 MotA/TolQ/ExbB proton channel [Desulfurivibrio alkaliphilus AHT 2]
MLQLFHSGGPLMYPLLACSVIALAVVIERGLFWALVEYHRRRELVDEVLELSRAGRLEKVREKVSGCRDYVVRILISGILHRDFSPAKAMEAAAADELQRMRRFMGVLDTMITVAPLLGILGTVVGIINSFEMLEAAGIEEPGKVTAGIAQALITTATGLSIAIFAVFPYNYFNARAENAVLNIEKYATSLEIIFQKTAEQVPAKSAEEP